MLIVTCLLAIAVPGPSSVHGASLVSGRKRVVAAKREGLGIARAFGVGLNLRRLAL
jgi:hypothetical protein